MNGTAVVDVRDALALLMVNAANPAGIEGPILGPRRVFRDDPGQSAEGIAAANRLADPDGGPAGYLILGDPDERPSGFYNGQTGQAGHQRIHGWARTRDDAARLYGWLAGMVNDQRLTIAGHVEVEGELSLSGLPPDATAYQADMVYRYDVLDT